MNFDRLFENFNYYYEWEGNKFKAETKLCLDFLTDFLHGYRGASGSPVDLSSSDSLDFDCSSVKITVSRRAFEFAIVFSDKITYQHISGSRHWSEVFFHWMASSVYDVQEDSIEGYDPRHFDKKKFNLFEDSYREIGENSGLAKPCSRWKHSDAEEKVREFMLKAKANPFFEPLERAMSEHAMGYKESLQKAIEQIKLYGQAIEGLSDKIDVKYIEDEPSEEDIENYGKNVLSSQLRIRPKNKQKAVYIGFLLSPKSSSIFVKNVFHKNFPKLENIEEELNDLSRKTEFSYDILNSVIEQYEDSSAGFLRSSSKTITAGDIRFDVTCEQLEELRKASEKKKFATIRFPYEKAGHLNLKLLEGDNVLRAFEVEMFSMGSPNEPLSVKMSSGEIIISGRVKIHDT